MTDNNTTYQIILLTEYPVCPWNIQTSAGWGKVLTTILPFTKMI